MVIALNQEYDPMQKSLDQLVDEAERIGSRRVAILYQ